MTAQQQDGGMRCLGRGGMIVGPQAIGIGMDLFGPGGFGWTLALFFIAYMALTTLRIVRNAPRP